MYGAPLVPLQKVIFLSGGHQIKIFSAVVPAGLRRNVAVGSEQKILRPNIFFRQSCGFIRRNFILNFPVLCCCHQTDDVNNFYICWKIRSFLIKVIACYNSSHASMLQASLAFVAVFQVAANDGVGLYTVCAPPPAPVYRRRRYCRGNGSSGRHHPRSRLPSQCSAAESWAATAI